MPTKLQQCDTSQYLKTGSGNLLTTIDRNCGRASASIQYMVQRIFTRWGERPATGLERLEQFNTME